MGGTQPDNTGNYEKAITRLNRLAGFAWLALWVEKIWQLLWPPISIILLFLAVSWFGIWDRLPIILHYGLLLLLAGAFLYSLKGFLFLRPPSMKEALCRVDRDSNLSHGQAETFNDHLAIGRDDETSRRLWYLHRQRAAKTIATMRVATPNPDMPRRDRYALRSIPLLLAVAAAFVAGPEKTDRIQAAFVPPAAGNTNPPASGTPALTAWINPPPYTGMPPQMLDILSESKTVHAPQGSRLILNRDRKAGIALTFTPEPAPEESTASLANDTGQLEQQTFRLEQNTSLTARSGLFRKTETRIELTPDRPPVIHLDNTIRVNHRGSFVLSYRGNDDFGIRSVEAEISTPSFPDAVVEPPRVSLQPPPQNAADREQHQTIDLTEHPLAGTEVSIILIARDDASQEGRSNRVLVTLPERPFTVPLALSLVELRRMLVLEPHKRNVVMGAIDGLLVAPETFTPQAGVFIGLRHVADLVMTIRTKEDYLTAAEWLWAMAVQIEDGALSDAEKQLRDARDKLQDALARGADRQETERLASELREAMNRYLQELATRMQQNRKQSNMSASGQGMSVSADDLNRLFDRVQELMQQGRTEEARQLLEQLGGIFDNMQMSRPGQSMNDPMVKEMTEAMAELNRLLSDQQKLRDDTYERGRQDNLYPEQPRTEDQTDFKALHSRQNDLSQRLRNLMEKGRKLGLKPDENLGEAATAMKEAEQALESRMSGDASEAQGRAVEALQKGSQQMMQQAQQMFSNGKPSSAAGNSGMGRSINEERKHIRDAGERVRKLMELLRNRLSDPARPKDELEYFERLLRQN